MEEALQVLRELEALKKQVLERHPEAATAFEAASRADTAAHQDGALPGQVEDSNDTKDTGSTTKAVVSAADPNSAVVELVQKEVSQRVDALRQQVWKQLVREELRRLAASSPTKTEAVDGVHDTDTGQASHHAHHHHTHHKRSYEPNFIFGSVNASAGLHSARSTRSQQHSHRSARSAKVHAEGETPGEDTLGSSEAQGDDAALMKSSDGSDDKLDEDDDPDAQWVSVSENAYGAFIHVGLQSGFIRAWQKCWTMLIVSIIIAVVFSGELIQRHQFFGDRSVCSICSRYFSLVPSDHCCIVVFYDRQQF